MTMIAPPSSLPSLLSLAQSASSARREMRRHRDSDDTEQEQLALPLRYQLPISIPVIDAVGFDSSMNRPLDTTDSPAFHSTSLRFAPVCYSMVNQHAANNVPYYRALSSTLPSRPLTAALPHYSPTSSTTSDPSATRRSNRQRLALALQVARLPLPQPKISSKPLGADHDQADDLLTYRNEELARLHYLIQTKRLYMIAWWKMRGWKARVRSVVHIMNSNLLRRTFLRWSYLHTLRLKQRFLQTKGCFQLMKKVMGGWRREVEEREATREEYISSIEHTFTHSRLLRLIQQVILPTWYSLALVKQEERRRVQRIMMRCDEMRYHITLRTNASIMPIWHAAAQRRRVMREHLKMMLINRAWKRTTEYRLHARAVLVRTLVRVDTRRAFLIWYHEMCMTAQRNAVCEKHLARSRVRLMRAVWKHWYDCTQVAIRIKHPAVVQPYHDAFDGMHAPYLHVTLMAQMKSPFDTRAAHDATSPAINSLGPPPPLRRFHLIEDVAIRDPLSDAARLTHKLAIEDFETKPHHDQPNATHSKARNTSRTKPTRF